MVSIRASLYPIFIVSKILGLFPNSKSLYYYSLLVNFGLSGFVGWKEFTAIYNFDWSASGVSGRTGQQFFKSTPKNACTKLLLLVGTAAPLYWMLRCPEWAQDLHKKLINIINVVGRENLNCSYFNMFALLVCFPVYFYFPILHPRKTDRPWKVRLSMFQKMIPFNWTFIVSIQLLAFLEIILALFRSLNKNLSRMENLEQAIMIHAKLCSMVPQMARMFTWPLLCSFYEMWVNLVSLFQGTMALHEKENSSLFNEGTFPLKIYLDITKFIFIWAICYVAYEVTYESDNFVDALTKEMRTRKSDCYNNKLLLYVTLRPAIEVTLLNGALVLSTELFVGWLSSCVAYVIVFWGFK